MGLFLTLLYILAAYLGPQTIFGPLAEYHIELIIAFLALVASIPSMQGSGVFRLPQAYALIGMSCAVFLSFIFNALGSLAPAALFDFLPNSFTFFFIVWNCKKKRHLQMVILVLFFACLFTIYKGYSALQSDNILSPYLVGQGNDAGVSFYRLRGLSFISDPNDFAQLIVSLIPCLFFFWRPGKLPRNLLFVLIPAGLLLFGMFLTHSRGSIIALLAVVIIAVRPKIGTVPSLILAAALFAVATVIGWSGGRQVSVEAGAGRMEAWSVGLDLLKHHPLFGVGFQRFGEYFEITAHNSIVVCAAELGMLGLFFWVMFVIPTFRDALTGSAVARTKDKEPEKTPFELAIAARAAATPVLANSNVLAYSMSSLSNRVPDNAQVNSRASAAPYYHVEEPTQLTDEEIQRLARLLMISLSGFLVAGWFLSRAYVMTLFIYGGIVQVIYNMALDKGIIAPRMKFPRVIRLSAISAVCLVIIVYIMLRIQHLMPT